jgi:hypothetical protein
MVQEVTNSGPDRHPVCQGIAAIEVRQLSPDPTEWTDFGVLLLGTTVFVGRAAKLYPHIVTSPPTTKTTYNLRKRVSVGL